MDAKKLGETHAMPHFHLIDGTIRIEGGLSLRQHFAGLALQGLMANGEYRPQHSHCNSFASLSVAMADALLRELAKEPT